MVIETNRPPKMMDILMDRQVRVNAGGRINRMFFLKTSDPGFGLRALLALVRMRRVEITPVGQGDVLCRLVNKLG